MDEKVLSNDIAKEVLTVLFYSSKEIQDAIPEDFVKKLTSLAADSDIEVNLKKDVPLSKQELSEDALDVFAIIYCLYVANDQEREKILSQWVINDYN